MVKRTMLKEFSYGIESIDRKQMNKWKVLTTEEIVAERRLWVWKKVRFLDHLKSEGCVNKGWNPSKHLIYL